jgi:hypothetical protein
MCNQKSVAGVFRYEKANGTAGQWSVEVSGRGLLVVKVLTVYVLCVVQHPITDFQRRLVERVPMKR